jgi:glycogen debranching enzyme
MILFFENFSSRAPDPTDDTEYTINPAIVSRRGIYKDVYGSGSGREWSDYQFRPNFPIAMTVAPEMFDHQHAFGALKLADQILRGPLGMKTLDPADQQYRPTYDNANDSYDPAIAKGLNYHNVRFLIIACSHHVKALSQGPEWGWPLGYFLRAYLHFATRSGAGNEVGHTPTGYSRLKSSHRTQRMSYTIFIGFCFLLAVISRTILGLVSQN